MFLRARCLLALACAALLRAACAVHEHDNMLPDSLRNAADATIALGTIEGADIVTLPEIQIHGDVVELGFPDNCAHRNKFLMGTLAIVSNNDPQAPAPELVADDPNDALSHVRVSCIIDYDRYQTCPEGLTVTTYQYCTRVL